jgi:hypothetical protein
MAMTNDVKNTMLDAGFGTGATSGTWISLHNGDPTTTVATAAANESVGAPYARQQLNLAAAAAGAKALAANAVIPIQAGDTFSHYALWAVVSGGTQAQFKGSAALSAAEGAYGSNGTYTISALSLTL